MIKPLLKILAGMVIVLSILSVILTAILAPKIAVVIILALAAITLMGGTVFLVWHGFVSDAIEDLRARKKQ